MRKQLILALGLFSSGLLLGLAFTFVREPSVTVQNKTLAEPCPYVLASIPEKYIVNDKGSMQVVYPPIAITNFKARRMRIPFNPDTPSAVVDTWKNMKKEDPTLAGNNPWQETDIDVDGDGKAEKVLIGSVSMSHGQNIVEVVKDNNVIFMKSDLVAATVSATPNHNGFFLSSTYDLWDGHMSTKTTLTRYVFQHGTFSPLWQQISCSVI